MFIQGRFVRNTSVLFIDWIEEVDAAAQARYAPNDGLSSLHGNFRDSTRDLLGLRKSWN